MTPFVWAILAALCWGIAPLFEKAGLQGPVDPVIGVLIRSVGVLAGAALFLPLLAKVHATQTTSLRTWICLGLGGLLASILGQACFYHALKYGEVSCVVPVGASYPVLACLLGLLFLNESLTLTKTLGIILVVVGTLLLR
jgi:transporter family protein